MPKDNKINHRHSYVNCPFCNLTNMNEADFIRHKKEKHQTSKFSCSLCSYSTSKWRKWTKHVTGFHSEDVNSKENANLSLHKHKLNTLVEERHTVNRLNEPDSVINCPFCQFSTSVEADFCDHVNKDHPMVRFTCNFCCFATSKWKKWKKHRLSCNTFANETENMANNSTLENSLNEKSVINCPFCSFRTLVKADFLDHKKREHPRLKSACPSCSFSTSKWKKWRKHKISCHSSATGTSDVASNNVHSENNSLLVTNSVPEEIEKVTLNCSMCSFKTYDKASLFDHKKNEHVEVRFACDLCPFSTSKCKKFEKHQVSCHSAANRNKEIADNNILYGDGIFDNSLVKEVEVTVVNCPFCSYITTEYANFLHHKKEEHPEARFACESCSFSTKKWKKWKKHKINHHSLEDESKESMISNASLNREVKENNVFRSVSSDISFVNENELQSHQGESVISNEVAGKPDHEISASGLLNGNRRNKTLRLENIISELKEYRFHKDLIPSQSKNDGYAKETGEEKCKMDFGKDASEIPTDAKDVFACDKCNYSAKNKAYLRKHLKITHSEQRIHECEECGEKFKTVQVLKRHKLRHSNLGQFCCGHCGKSFKEKGNLERHVLTHTDFKPFKCKECGFSTNQQASLRYHLAIHTGIRPHACQKCNKTFKTKYDLTTHFRIHTGERPYKCSSCDYTAISRPALIQHERAHTKDTPFKCHFCNYASSSATNLKSHLKSHMGVKPYACSQCEYATTFPSNLKSHMRTHTGERPFSCEKCSKAFKMKSHLQKHCRTVHS